MIAFISSFFSSLKNCFCSSQQLLDTSRQLGYLSSSSVSFYRILNGFSIHQETFYMLDRCSIVGRSIEVGFCLIVARQLLDPSRFSCMHCFLHVLHLFIILFHYIHAFIWILCSPLIIFIFLE